MLRLIKAKLTELAIRWKVRREKPCLPLGENPMIGGSWYVTRLPGTVCADGSESCLFLKKGTVDRLLIMFSGGGVSWSEETARHPFSIPGMLRGEPPLYYPSGDPVMASFTLFLQDKRNGLLSNIEENPFRAWNMAVIHYATGDFHIGNGQLAYTDAKGVNRILYHHGYLNFFKSMQVIKERFPRAEKLVITGCSARAFAVPALAAEIMTQYPKVQDVTVYSDSALSLKEDFPALARSVWRVPEHLVSAVRSNNITLDFFRRLTAEQGTRIKYLYSNSVRDEVFASFRNYIRSGKYEPTAEMCHGFEHELRTFVAELQAIIPGIGLYINDFAAPGGGNGTEHCVGGSSSFLDRSIDGITPAKWLSDAVDGVVYSVGLDLLNM